LAPVGLARIDASMPAVATIAQVARML
jgi:hypothetical protein